MASKFFKNFTIFNRAACARKLAFENAAEHFNKEFLGAVNSTYRRLLTEGQGDEASRRLMANALKDGHKQAERSVDLFSYTGESYSKTPEATDAMATFLEAIYNETAILHFTKRDARLKQTKYALRIFPEAVNALLADLEGRKAERIAA